MAAHHPLVELLGISTVHGNSSVEHTTYNAGSILTAIGRGDIPVYVGATKPLFRKEVYAPGIHGESGLDGTDLLPKPSVPAIRTISAVDAMASALFATPPNTACLIATGVLTNIAVLFEQYPSLATHIKSLSIMGGAIGGGFSHAPMGMVDDKQRIGNYTPFAEFNVVCDPEAASAIFMDDVVARKTVLIPLDITHQVLATAEVQQMLLHGNNSRALERAKPSTLRVMLVELLNFFAHTYATVFGLTDGPPLHDPLALAVIFDGIPEIEIPFIDIKDPQHGRERYHVRILTEGTFEEAVSGKMQTGRSIATLLPPGSEGVKIPRTLDVKKFWSTLEECVERADKHNSVAGKY